MTAASLLLALALIAANGFFVGAEFAVLAARRSRLEPLLRTSRRARTALRAIEQLPLMISACQFGITLASLGLGALAEPAVASVLAGPLAALHVPHGLVHPLALGIALTLVSCLHMLLGEMVPKNLALTGPERAAMMLTPALLIFVRIFRPIIIGLTAVATGVLRVLRIKPVSEIGDVVDRDSVAALIGESSDEGLLQANQHELLSGALAFEETNAEIVGLPREALITVAPDVTPDDIEQLVTATGYSRFPVRADDQPSTAADLIGYIHLADVLDTEPGSRNRPVDPHCIRPLGDIPATATLQTALATLRRSGSHLARLIDENGQTRGVIALEDILEQLVGEVADATRRPDATGQRRDEEEVNPIHPKPRSRDLAQARYRQWRRHSTNRQRRDAGQLAILLGATATAAALVRYTRVCRRASPPTTNHSDLSGGADLPWGATAGTGA
jgi:CBS domain containing-hemolysin-like protein